MQDIVQSGQLLIQNNGRNLIQLSDKQVTNNTKNRGFLFSSRFFLPVLSFVVAI